MDPSTVAYAVSQLVARRHEKPYIGTGLVGILALVLTYLDLYLILSSAYSVPVVWAVLQVPVVIAAWVAVVAWLQRRWALEGLCLLLTLAGLWGYLYLGPALPLIMASVAACRALRGRRTRLAMNGTDARIQSRAAKH